MPFDVETLGLRMDGEQLVRESKRVEGALESVGVRSEQVQKKTEHFAMAAGFAIGSFASDTNRNLSGVLHALSTLGFAFGPIVGGITLAVAAIGDAFYESHKRSTDE